MKSILNLNGKKAKTFLLKRESYSKIDLPLYFTFQDLLDRISRELEGKNLSEYQKSSPRDYENVNYHLLSNKDGMYAWRPFQLIHPAIYVSLVHKITEQENWKVIKKRFKQFQRNKRIECHSMPVESESKNQSDKSAQIMTWWKKIEQRSLELALDFKYVLHTDISDCYSSIYTHSIPWAIHTKKEAKKRKNRNNNALIGVIIDRHLQDMSYGQTNGIPQGTVLMDLIAEMVLGQVDLLLTNRLAEIGITDYHILRFRDDYRIFTNNSFHACNTPHY